MNKTIIEIIKDICNIPVDCHEMGTISVYDLTKQSGYFENQNSISSEDIKKYLLLNTNIANEWLQYSEDKRTDSGWYFTKNDKHNKYIVGYLSNGNRCNETVFSNIVDACTMFILSELEVIRQF